MYTYRKILLSTLLLSPFYQAKAEPYLGANLGASVVTINKEVNYQSTTTDLSDKYYGVRGQLLAGYNFHSADNFTLSQESKPDYDGPSHDELFLAIEFDGDFNSSRATANVNPWFLTTSASVVEQLEYSFDFFVLPKYRFAKNIILFIGPGYSQGYFLVSTPSVTSGNLGVTGNHHIWQPGWSIKAGAEIPFCGNINIVLTYQYGYFSNLTWDSVEPLTGQNVTAKYQPVVNSLTLGFNWM